jgi:uncharacterized RDD family membrane protein YckC
MKEILHKQSIPEIVRPGIRWLVTGVEYFIILASFNLSYDRRNPGTNHVILFLVIWVIYFPLAEGITGRTIGKKLFGIKVVGKDFSEVGFTQAFLRRILDIVDFIPVFGILGLFIAAINKQNRRIGDLVAGTVVVKG